MMLTRMHNGVAAMENGMKTLQNLKIELPHDAVISSEYLSKRLISELFSMAWFSTLTSP